MKNRQFIVFALLLACPLLLHGQETFFVEKNHVIKVISGIHGMEKGWLYRRLDN